jgi:hypothetical protein
MSFSPPWNESMVFTWTERNSWLSYFPIISCKVVTWASYGDTTPTLIFFFWL